MIACLLAIRAIRFCVHHYRHCITLVTSILSIRTEYFQCRAWCLFV
jgi:hypothetical protein